MYQKYNIIKKDNKVFIKILFRDIHIWDKILSEIFDKEITIYPENLTTDKEINNLYKKFKNEYKVPKSFIYNQLKNDKEFKIYNTQDDQEDYIKKWIDNSY